MYDEFLINSYIKKKKIVDLLLKKMYIALTRSSGDLLML